MTNPSDIATEADLAEAFALALGRPDGASELTAAEAVFVAQVFADYVPGELAGATLADLAANLAGFWTHAGKRAGTKPQIRRVKAVSADKNHPLAFDRLEIVQDDSRFLVDSIMGEIADAGLPVRAMYHAVVETVRSPSGARAKRGKAKLESMIVVFFDPLPAARADALIASILETLADVHAAVGDYDAMLGWMDRATDQIGEAVHVHPDALAEYATFLRWLRDNHFILLGARSYDYPRTADGGYAAEEGLIEPERSLGLLRDPKRGVLRRDHEPAVLSAAMRTSLAQAEPLMVAKSNMRSKVHRRVYMDYVGERR